MKYNNRFSFLILIFFCTAIFFCAVVMSKPYLETGVSDDSSYIYTVKVFSETGKIVYPSWSATMLGFQILIGALYVKLFGFSFMSIRYSTILISILAGIALLYIGKTSKVNNHKSFLYCIGLILSPIYMSLSMSFMSDNFGLFFAIITFILFKFANEEQYKGGKGRYVLLSITGLVIGFLAGTIRQVFWVMPFSCLICSIINSQDKKNRWFYLCGLILLFFSASVLNRMFYDQPGVTRIDVLSGLRRIATANIGYSIFYTFTLVNTVCLFILPLSLYYSVSYIRGLFGKRNSRMLFKLLVFGFFMAILLILEVYYFNRRKSDSTWIYWGTTLSSGGMYNWPIYGVMPRIIPQFLEYCVAFLIGFCNCVYIFNVFSFLKSKGSVNNVISCFKLRFFDDYTVFVMLMFSFLYVVCIFVAGYCIGVSMDRYVMPLYVSVGLLVVRGTGGESLRDVAWSSVFNSVIAVFMFFTSTFLVNDFFFQSNLRLGTIKKLEKSGIKRKLIASGMDQDLWFQFSEIGKALYYEDSPFPGRYAHARYLTAFEAKYEFVFSHDMDDSDVIMRNTGKNRFLFFEYEKNVIVRKLK